MKQFTSLRNKIVLGLAALVFTLGPGAAYADSPHFIKVSFTLDTTGADAGDLTCTFKEAGLGDNLLITEVCSANATAVYVCVNKGGANPSAQNKTTVSGPVSATGQFASGKNGQITGSLTIEPPPSDISCPNGQSLELASVTYVNVTITDQTNNVSESAEGGAASTGCLLPNVRGAC